MLVADFVFMLNGILKIKKVAKLYEIILCNTNKHYFIHHYTIFFFYRCIGNDMPIAVCQIIISSWSKCLWESHHLWFILITFLSMTEGQQNFSLSFWRKQKQRQPRKLSRNYEIIFKKYDSWAITRISSKHKNIKY